MKLEVYNRIWIVPHSENARKKVNAKKCSMGGNSFLLCQNSWWLSWTHTHITMITGVLHLLCASEKRQKQESGFTSSVHSQQDWVSIHTSYINVKEKIPRETLFKRASLRALRFKSIFHLEIDKLFMAQKWLCKSKMQISHGMWWKTGESFVFSRSPWWLSPVKHSSSCKLQQELRVNRS